MTSVLWYRRDLRVHDLPALTAAAESGPVAPLFVFDERLLHGRWPSPNRVAFLLDCLRELDAELARRGVRLHVRRGQPEREVPGFAREVGATRVFVSRDYSPFARRRDAAVNAALAASGIGFHARRGTLVHEPEDLRSSSGEPFTVFSSFLRRWSSLPRRALLSPPGRIVGANAVPPGTLPALGELGLEIGTAQLLEAGEAAARERLRRFTAGPVSDYARMRNGLGAEATSRLSQDLKWGTLSPLEVVSAAGAAPADAGAFVAEVAWRDFYHHVLWHHPRVLREPFQRQLKNVRWDHRPKAFDAWREGRTGYPVVDAAMRQLLATGFMHNRARMIVASFLTKDLHIDWRLGEAHFMEHLVDGDVASNNGGWQWAASTGTDPQPYFRIFNPVLQGQKFDSDGSYVRRWVPELGSVPASHIHEPWTMPAELQHEGGCIIGRDYPAPIVDHRRERLVALERYGEARASDG